MIAHIYPSVLQAVSGRGYAGRLEGSIPGYRGGAIQDLGYELPRIPIPRTRVNKARRRAGAYSSSGPSCEISALTLVPPELFYALPHERYLGAAICVLRIRRRERSLVDAARHQVLERPRLPGVEEVHVHGGVRTRR
jgi:hypothetical protein